MDRIKEMGSKKEMNDKIDRTGLRKCMKLRK